MQASFSAATGFALQLDDHASTAYLHALIQYNPIAIIVLDSQHKFQLCNPAFLDLFKFEAAELETWALDSMIAGPDFLLEATELTHRVLSGKRVHTVTKRRRKDGLIIDVELHGVPLIVDGVVLGVYGLYQDVTERMDVTAVLEQMTTRLDVVREEERRRFARDLHDSLSQDLALLTWNLRRISKLVAGDARMESLLAQTSELADVCVGQIRTSSFLMHPPQLGEADLHTAILWLTEGFERRSGIEIELHLEPMQERLPLALETALYRFIQEGLANVLRHARESSISLTLSFERDLLQLTLANYVASMPAPVSGLSLLHGVGLSSMRERLLEFGGTLRVTSTGRGVELCAQVPLGERILCVS
ncbi:PAS domain-containing sensor histidine kinase [Terriglobus roseus]|uniref:histidine kinase n=1 Tax=Terriglobus roseus TaxID=392734 RepID=A0A1H4JA42_9BACT|nr:PAS domain S-box protein [Terriglobus roseus]SEB42925.1 PAS domain S-box-containing protein [Terriglobus roseus]